MKMKLTTLYRNKLFVCLLLVLTVVLVYFPVLKNDFLYLWDDQWVAINYYTQGGFNMNNLWRILTEFYHGQYAPLNELNYLVLYTAFGYNPFWFHLASLLWHVANVVLVYLLINRLLVYSHLAEGKSRQWIAFLTAFLFGIHPLTVESTAWISASKVLIYTFYYLLALLAYLQYLQTNKARYYMATLVLFCCSFLGKEQAVTMPLCLILIDWFTGRNMKNANHWIEKIPFFALALFFGLITILSQQGGGNAPQYPFTQRIVLSFYTLFEYLVKTIFPFKLSYIYPFPMQVGESIPLRFLIYPVIVAFLAYMLYLYRSNRVLVFSLLFFVIHLSVAIHIISTSRFAIVADRYVYLSLVGIMFLIVYYFIHLVKKKRMRKIFLPALLLYGIYLGVYTHTYSKQWKDTDSLKKHLRELLEQRDDYEGSVDDKTKQLME